MKALLVATEGLAERFEHVLEPGKSYAVGRSQDADLVLDHASVSRKHCKLIFAPPGKWVITDLGSRNGVWVNDRRVSTELLSDGDVIRLGKVRLEFSLIPAVATPSPPPPAPPAPPVAPAGPATGTVEAPSPPTRSRKLPISVAAAALAVAVAAAALFVSRPANRPPQTPAGQATEAKSPQKPVKKKLVRPPRKGKLIKVTLPADTKGLSPLHLAVIEDRLEAARLLLDKGANPDSDTGFGTPLHLAAATNNVPLALLLLDRGATINARDARRQTPLHLAALHGGEEVAECLLDRGAEVACWTIEGLTPLHLAAGAGHTGVLKVLLEAEADPNMPNSYGHWTPLHEAAAKGQVAAAELLIAKGANVNARTSTVTGGGSTPLHEAARAGHSDMVKLLLARGADPNALDSDGQTYAQLSPKAVK